MWQGRGRGGYGVGGGYGAAPYGRPAARGYAPSVPYRAAGVGAMRPAARGYVAPRAPVLPVRRAYPAPVARARGPMPAYQPRPVAPAPQQYQPRPAGRPGLENAHLYTQVERSLADILHRYPNLSASPDLHKMAAHWSAIPNLDIPLTVNIPFHTDPDLTLPVPAPEETPEGEGKTVARVMLLSMAKPEPEVEGKKTPKPHLTKQVKFLVAKKASGGLTAIGGAWSAAKDGGSPTSDKTLIKTAIRHCKETCGIDLSACKQWHKFVDVHYVRPNGAQDRTVIFVPDVWNHFASGEVKVYKQIETKEVEVMEEVEVEVEVEEKEGEKKEGEEKKTKMIKKKVPTKKSVDSVVIRSMDLSLNGILEYDLQDKHEETGELSMFAEVFDEMLSYKHAHRVRAILEKKRVETEKQQGELKRKRETEATERAAKLAEEREERGAKGQKVEAEKAAELARKKAREEEEKNMTEEQIKERREEEAKERKEKEEAEKAKREEEAKQRKEELERKKKEMEDAKKAKEEEEKAKTTRTVTVTESHVNEEILEPFAYFDKPMANGQQSGQIRRERMESILYSMGDLCSRQVEGLLRAVGLPAEKAHQSLYYRSLATTTTVTTKEVPKEAPKEEKKEEEKKEEEKKEEEKKEEEKKEEKMEE
eukprot:NODE_59_length_2184_cov_411.386417_g48_i0.p2 GENE.NODE_59_length_2184_cov_411.386417_g48_i0~~NODE_59_length_2184_cov_411.386417_g48_i0.p2  ORF type:complete len:649 (-),score=351.95 NODE_59_length_2184_cov_411.386417_g48_i0:163-2109(-)